MTPAQYRNHPQAPLRRAFFRGELARAAGLALSDNPYRKVGTTKKARRGSWSEAFTRAWSVGFRAAELAVPSVTGGDLK